MNQIHLHPKQEEALRYLLDKTTNTVLFGGSISTGKSRLIAYACLYLGLRYPGTRYLIGRKRLSDLRASTMKTFRDVASEMGIADQLEWNQHLNTVKLPGGSEVILRQLDLKPSDPDITELGSYEFTACFVDEVADIHVKVYQTLIQRCRYRLKEYGLIPKILLVSNPTKTPWVYNLYCQWEQGILPSNIKLVMAVPSDNPFNDANYLSTLTEEALGTEFYRSRVLGDWHYSSGDFDLFREEDILNCANWTTEGIDQSERYLTCDVGGSGARSDRTVITYWVGLVLMDVFEKRGLTTVEIAQELRRLMALHRVSVKNVIIDAVGLGQGVADLVRGSVQYKANNRPLNGEYYQMQKDQLYHRMAELVGRSEVRFKVPRITDTIIEELCAHKRHNSGKDQPQRVTPKDQVTRAIGRSPDVADAIHLRAYYTYRKNEFRFDTFQIGQRRA